MPGFFRENGDVVIVAVRATPGSSRDGVDRPVTRDDGQMWLSVKVRAKPDKGEANKAVIGVLAKAFGCPKTDVALVSGGQSRSKRFSIKKTPELLEALRRYQTEA